MTHSLNEVEALSKRAARGSGLSWGLSEEAGKAVRWLSSFGLPGSRLLADLLELNDRRPESDMAPTTFEGVWQAPGDSLNPIIAGASLSDCATRLLDQGQIQLQNINQPLLALPFVGSAALRLQTPVSVSWEGSQLVTDGQRLCIDADATLVTPFTSMMTVSIPATMTDPKEPEVRAEMDADIWERLSHFAHRTYAPATEESRLRGAGAGTSDND